ncbi:hypothetical protein [Dyadobacter sp. 32]|uniref:hypothetical protein n=1 Tax=Dyadobacter sp. 32 TaxID=538966 RepID=UPI0011EC98C7
MKKHITFFLLITLLAGCVQDQDAAIKTALKEGMATGEWTAASTGGGFDNFSSFKNFQYNFEVTDANQILVVELTSADIDVRYALFDDLGDRIETSATGRQVGGPYTAKRPGVYRVVVTAERRAIGKFSLKVAGTKAGLVPIPFQTLRSETQNWGPSGGGGLDKTFKNHFYTFEINDDNTSVDIELQSADTEVLLFLYDALGALVTSQSANRYEYILKLAKKGIYTVMVGSYKRASVGNYSLNIFGKVQNIKRVPSNSETKTDTWSAGKIGDIGHTYSLEITSENNSPLDIELSSADTKVHIELQNAVGTYISQVAFSNNSVFHVSKELPKGKYRLLIKPAGGSALNSPGGKYNLTVIGQFANLKKM